MNPTQNTPSTAPAVDITPADILRGAARYLETHGWNQGTYFDPASTSPFPPACLIGAINLACFGETNAPMRYNRPEWPLFLDAQQVLLDYLAHTAAVHTRNDDLIVTQLHRWNDEASRTAEQVVACLRGAANNYDDWTHATEDDLETYAEHEYDHERLPTREGFLAWRAAR